MMSALRAMASEGGGAIVHFAMSSLRQAVPNGGSTDLSPPLEQPDGAVCL